MSKDRAPALVPGKAPTEAASRALAEAAARRAREQEAASHPPEEIGGAAGPDPTRYGDWEHKGRAIDF